MPGGSSGPATVHASSRKNADLRAKLRGARTRDRRSASPRPAGAEATTAAPSPRRAAKDLKGQTITYWASNQGAVDPEDYRILKREAAKFTAQSGVKVDIKVIGSPDLFDDITAAGHRAARGLTS